MIRVRVPAKIATLVLLLAARLPATQIVPPQELPVDTNAGALIKRVRAAIGDEAAWNAAAMVTRTGTMEFVDDGKKFNMKAIEGRGDLNLTTITSGAQFVGAGGCDGNSSWERTENGVRVHTGDESQEGLDDCRYLSDIDLAGYKEVKVSAKARQAEKEFYLVDAYTRAGRHYVLTVNAQTFLPEAVIQQKHEEGHAYTRATVLSDYRRVGGLLIPHVMEIKNGSMRMVVRFESVLVSPTLDKSIFARPKS